MLVRVLDAVVALGLQPHTEAGKTHGTIFGAAGTNIKCNRNRVVWRLEEAFVLRQPAYPDSRIRRIEFRHFQQRQLNRYLEGEDPRLAATIVQAVAIRQQFDGRLAGT